MADRRHLVLRADDVMPFQVPHAQHYLYQEILCSENTRLHDGFLNRGTLRPHSALGGGAHPKHDEIYYILSGYGTIRLGGDPKTGDGAETYLMEEGSVVYIPANTFHALRNDSEHDIVFLGRDRPADGHHSRCHMMGADVYTILGRLCQTQ